MALPSTPETVRVKGRMTVTHLNAAGEVVGTRAYDNLICTGMDSLLAAFLNGEAPPLGTLYCAVGTGTTAPAYADVQLTTELARAAMSLNARALNIANLTFLFTPAQANGTLTEAGVFVNASGTANSGTLINHVLINEVKTNVTTLIVQATFTIQ